MSHPLFATVIITKVLGKNRLAHLHSEARTFGCTSEDTQASWTVATLIAKVNAARERYWDSRQTATPEPRSPKPALAPRKQWRTRKDEPPADVLPASEINAWLQSLPRDTE